MPLYGYRGRWPRLAPTAFVAPGAHVIGDVTLGERASVWYGAVVRGDIAAITVGDGTNIQDGAVVHVDTDLPARIGNDITIGHRAVVHGCTVRDGAMIGMGAIVLNRAEIGEEAVVAAGALVTEGQVIPPRSLAVGVPARVVREVGPELTARVRAGVAAYQRLAAEHRAGEQGGGAAERREGRRGRGSEL